MGQVRNLVGRAGSVTRPVPCVFNTSPRSVTWPDSSFSFNRKPFWNCGPILGTNHSNSQVLTVCPQNRGTSVLKDPTRPVIFFKDLFDHDTIRGPGHDPSRAFRPPHIIILGQLSAGCTHELYGVYTAFSEQTHRAAKCVRSRRYVKRGKSCAVKDAVPRT